MCADSSPDLFRSQLFLLEKSKNIHSRNILLHSNKTGLKSRQILSWQLLNKNKMRENRHNRSENFYSSERDHESSPALTDLAKKEQAHRHQWQDKYLQLNNSTFRAGQIFGLIYNLALLYLVYDLIQDGEKILALKIFALNIAIIGFALLVTMVERKILSRKPPRRSFNNRGRNDQRRSGDRDRNAGRERGERSERR